MIDYYAVLKRKIRDASEDPAKMRELVYEAARLALKRQMNAQQPTLAFAEIERHAIATAVRNVPPPQLCHRGVKRERSDEE
jgi:hypothetical protein